MAEPRRPPVYVVAVCDDAGCTEVLLIDDAETRARAVHRLAEVAEALRWRGARGTLVLTEEATGAVVAARPLRPSPAGEGGTP